jgi:hypothetical protein
VHHLVLVVRHLLDRTVYAPQLLRVHVGVLFCNTHLIFSLSCSTIVVESEEISFSVVALVRHGLTALLVLKTARIARRLELSVIWLRLLISSCIVLVESHSKVVVALRLVYRGRVVAFLLIIVVILVVILVILLRLRDRLAICLVKDGPVRFHVLSGHHWKGTDWAVCRALETLPSHVEVLQLQLLNTRL